MWALPVKQQESTVNVSFSCHFQVNISVSFQRVFLSLHDPRKIFQSLSSLASVLSCYLNGTGRYGQKFDSSSGVQRNIFLSPDASLLTQRQRFVQSQLLCDLILASFDFSIIVRFRESIKISESDP